MSTVKVFYVASIYFVMIVSLIGVLKFLFLGGAPEIDPVELHKRELGLALEKAEILKSRGRCYVN